MLKRLFDFCAAGIGIIILSPLFIIIAIWIKSDSSGPVFYRQVRVGQFGRNFRIHKFRTMRINADLSGQLTVGDDQRITNSGKFLRKYKIDELPQLIDVIQGSMSLVGPRPEVPEFIAYYPAEIRAKVLSVRPGLTDRASIEMVDENEILAHYEDARKAYIDVILPLKQNHYLKYVENRSFREDIKILLATIIKVISR
jgi:lipopolysaccharide/colanic/teichoic acid biosynthesis glycosyltransferase